MPRTTFSFLRNNQAIIITLVVITILYFFVSYRIRKVEQKGIFTIAKVTSFQGAASGSFLYLDIYYRDKIYKSSIDKYCNSCIGKYFYVKMDTTDIARFISFYEDKQVPNCILKKYSYYPGWASIPFCDN